MPLVRRGKEKEDNKRHQKITKWLEMPAEIILMK